MDDNEKLEITRAKFKAKIDSVATWQDFKNLIININKTQIKNFIKNALQSEADQRRDVFAVEEVNKAGDLETLKDEVDLI